MQTTNMITLQGTCNLILTQVLVVGSHIRDKQFDPALELGSSEHLPDILVVVDHYGGKCPKI